MCGKLAFAAVVPTHGVPGDTAKCYGGLNVVGTAQSPFFDPGPYYGWTTGTQLHSSDLQGIVASPVFAGTN